MYISLPLRLTLFYALIVGLALWFFSITVYNQAEQRVYNDLDSTLSNSAASVRLGKDLFPGFPSTTASPLILPSVDGLGVGGVAIEVFDNQQRLLATTIGDQNNGMQTSVADLGSSPIPWASRQYTMLHNTLQQ